MSGRESLFAGRKERWKWLVFTLGAVGFVLLCASLCYLVVADWKPCAVAAWSGLGCYAVAVAVAFGADL